MASGKTILALKSYKLTYLGLIIVITSIWGGAYLFNRSANQAYQIASVFTEIFMVIMGISLMVKDSANYHPKYYN